MDTLEVCLHVSVSIEQKWQPSECNSVRFEFYHSSHCYCSNDSLHLFLSALKFLFRFFLESKKDQNFLFLVVIVFDLILIELKIPPWKFDSIPRVKSFI